MSEESPQERQDNEMEALQAIFGDQLVDNRPNIAWKIWRPLDLMLTLHPLHSSSVAGVHCSVTLHIKCCPNYPNKPPILKIHKLHGLSNENASKLLSELGELSTKLCGEVMIFELAQHTQTFLHSFNKPTLSFYDEMLERQNEIEKIKLHDRQVKENEERLKIKSEIQRRKEILRGSSGRVQRNSLSQDNDSEPPRDEGPELVFYADNKISNSKKVIETKENLPCNCSPRGVQIIRLTQKNNKKIHIGKCLGHSHKGSTTYLAIDSDSGETLIVKKWQLSPSTDYQLRSKQLTSLDQDFKQTSRLKHNYLVPYTSMETIQEINQRTTYQCIYLIREFILGCSVKFLKERVSLSDMFEVLRVMRVIGNGVFGALKELHSAGVLHRDVSCNNVFLSDGEVKLVGVGLDVRLAEIVDGDDYCERQTKSQDIFSAAQLLLSLFSSGNGRHDIPSQLPSVAKDFFSRCLTEDEHLQWTAEQLLNHGFLMDAPSQNPSSKLKDDGYSGSEDEEAVLAKSFVSHSLPASGHSRLSAEFEVLKWLGKGAFGDVLKVKNNLDGGFYAIKRIKLNPENVQLNKKITREVKLLSRLNHENVVRYFNAWIETITPIAEDSVDGSESVIQKVDVVPEVKPTVQHVPANSMEALAAKLAPGVKLEWSISETTVPKKDEVSDSESEDDAWFKMLPATTNLDESSSSIEFEEDSNVTPTISQDIPDSRTPIQHIQQVLYIQMEFCEKNTLRHAIDSGLYAEHFRAWRLFREIVCGLNHVHQRGMIHRDLKPVNIFLDSNDHVKIGDFGLATKAFAAPVVFDDKSKPIEEFGGSLTGQIGTALYVAPELLQGGNKVIYNQKVDIYSLGIILFEMFHPPLDTGMERMKVLTELRSKNITLPISFVCEDNAKQIHVIRWLLSHEASIRPTCAELLSSEHVPRAVPEGTLSALIAHTINEKGRSYQRLVNACLEQKATAAEDFTYHSGLRTKPDVVMETIKNAVIAVFKTHGATEFSTPLLLPRTKMWDMYPNAVKVMTAFGSVCHLPHDLRLPFARHVAYTETKQLRRFAVERVYREKHVEGFHPREMLECAFDIVTPNTGSLWSDAELLVVASKAASNVNLKVSITLNHTDMLKCLLMCCGVTVDRHNDLYPVLVDVRMGRLTSLQLQTHLTSLCISKKDTTNLLKLMETEVPLNEVRDAVLGFCKKAEWSRTISRAIAEMERVVNYAKAFGLDCSVTVAPCLAYNATQHNGVFWQMAVYRAERLNNHRGGDVIAVGGRYDALVEEFWLIAKTEKEHDAQLKASTVGISMSIERMVALIKKMDLQLNMAQCYEVHPKCVLINGATESCSDSIAMRRASIARDMWAKGLTAVVSDCSSVTEAKEVMHAHLVLTVEDGGVRIACWDDNRVREQRVPFLDVIDFLKAKLCPESSRNPEGYNRTTSWSETEKSNSPIISITFITHNEKMSKNSRRQCENQIYSHVSSWLSKVGVVQMSRVRVCVAASDAEREVVRAMAAYLDSPAQGDVNALSDSFPRRRRIINEIVGELQSMASMPVNQSKSADEPVLFAIYSIPDSYCKIIT